MRFQPRRIVLRACHLTDAHCATAPGQLSSSAAGEPYPPSTRLDADALPVAPAGPTVMAVDGDLNRFAEPEVDPAWLDPVLVVCPRCAARATVRGDRSRARLVCEACGLARTWDGDHLHVLVGGAPMVLDRGEHAWVDPDTGRGVRTFVEPQGADARFGAPLWLRSECCGGQLVWANNTAHLDYLEAYVMARLREDTPGPAPLSAKLPAWMKSAKNREEVSKHLSRLRRRLEATAP